MRHHRKASSKTGCMPLPKLALAAAHAMIAQGTNSSVTHSTSCRWRNAACNLYTPLRSCWQSSRQLRCCHSCLGRHGPSRHASPWQPPLLDSWELAVPSTRRHLMRLLLLLLSFTGTARLTDQEPKLAVACCFCCSASSPCKCFKTLLTIACAPCHRC